MTKYNPISLTQKLISFNTVNPPGNEAALAEFIAGLLSDNGFNVEYENFDENRLNLIAEKGLTEDNPPIVFSGHLDVVPLGEKKWSVDPFGGEVIDGKVFGRGSSDMKGGVAAIICAAIQAFEEGNPIGGVRIIFTASEENGCKGMQHLVKSAANLGVARAVIIAEPTANKPAIGHKGGLYLNVTSSGTTAHSSMPELGDNAIYKAAKAILKVEKFNFGCEQDLLLGFPTVNVGKMSGGLNLNSVPDHSEFTIDVRSTTKVRHVDILEKLKNELGNQIVIETLVDMPPVSSKEEDPFVQLVYEACQVDRKSGEYPKAMPYLTDGSVLQKFYKGVPTIILGCGEPEMAHQIDEFCFVRNIEESVEIYKKILLNKNL